MMRLPPFSWRAPRALDEALAILDAEGDGARLLAGGTDLLANLKRRHQKAETLVSLSRVAGLRGVQGDPQDGVEIGAMTSLQSICRDRMLREHYPGFVQAVASISAPSLRTMGTIGGNLCLDTRCTYYNQNEEWRQAIDYCMKAEGSICWVAPSSPRCWAISAADSVPVLIAIGAKVRIDSAAGTREVPVESLYRNDGIRYLTLERGEVLTALLLPPADGTRATYWKLRRRGSIDFPVLGVGAALRLEGGRVAAVRIVLGAVASAPLSAVDASSALAGAPLTEDAIAAAGKAARSLATPLDNTDFAMQWRARMVEVYVEGALRELGGLPARTTRPPHGTWALASPAVG